MSPAATTDRRQHAFLIVLFVAALLAHFHFATRNWQYRFMIGHEFRQTQTALIAHYIDQENNFSLDYSVPLLGKPWVLPLEFPLYQWGVVALSRATGWPQFQAARTISLASFYLTLPALFLLLGQLGLPRPRRLFVLACVLACPVYLFYSRAVLIDPTALLFSVWFLVAFTRMLPPRAAAPRADARWAWLSLVVLCGTAAGLIKSLVWFVWVIPAASYGAWRLWQDWRGGGLRPALRTFAWGVGSVVIPFAATILWTRHTDAIKAVHPSAYIFTSANLGIGNYGTFSLAAHFSAETWRNLLACWQQSLLPPWLFALFLLPGLAFLPAWRARIAGAAALFLAAQMSIPLAYALQDYYFYTANTFAAAAVAFVFLGLLDRLPRGIATSLLLVPLIAFFATYRASYFPWAQIRGNGGSGLTESLDAFTPPRSVIIVAGDDWSAIIPYYSNRKALMIRNGLEYDSAYLDRAFADLAGEEVSALVLIGSKRGDTNLIQRATQAFDIDPTPTYRHVFGDVHLARLYRDDALRGLLRLPFDQITIPPETHLPEPADATAVDLRSQARTTFSIVTPAPIRAQASFGFAATEIAGHRAINVHPDSDIWVTPPAGATRITIEYGIVPGAYTAADHDPTDGVEFIVDGELPNAPARTLYSRQLDPAKNPADRAVQSQTFEYQPRPGETLVFRTRPGASASFDWAFWQRIAVE